MKCPHCATENPDGVATCLVCGRSIHQEAGSPTHWARPGATESRYSHITTASLFAFAHFCHHLSNAILTPMMPWIRDAFQLSYMQSGMANSTFSILYGAAQLPLGSLADRFGRRFMMAFFALGGVSLAAMAIGVSREYWQLLVLLALMGIMGSGYHPLAGSLLGQQVRPEQRGQAYGIHLIGGNSGFLIAPLVAAAIATAFDWRVAYITLPIGGLVAAVLVFRAVYEPPLAKLPPSAGGVGIGRLMELLLPFRQVVVIARPIIPIVGLMAVVNFAQQTVGAFLPLFLVDAKGLPMAMAATMVALISGAGIIGAPIGGTLSDKFGRKPVMILSIALIGPFVYAIAMAPVGDWLVPWLVGSGLLLGLSRSLAQPVIDSLLADTVPAELRATAFGLYFFINSEMGGLGVPVVGYVIDQVGLIPTFNVISLGILGLSLLAVVVRRRI